jgi:tetratricopeptide (TPR) repeat protein
VDPKDRIAVYERYHGVLNEIASGSLSQAVFARIDGIRKEAPELRAVVFLEAQALEALGRPQEACAAYREGLDVEPANNVARAALGSLLARLGKTEDAEREFKRVLSNDPGDYRSRNNLAGIYATKGFGDLAIAELKKALATQPSYAAAWQNLGRLYAQKRAWPEAEAALRKAVDLDGADARLHLLLAQVLRNLGKAAEADQHARIARQLDPTLR